MADTIKAMLISSVTTPYNLGHEFVTDLVAGGIIQRSTSLGTKLVTSGVFDAADVTFFTVTGATVDAIIGYKDTGSDATSPLIWWMDVTPYGPVGLDIPVVWHSSGIFSI